MNYKLENNAFKDCLTLLESPIVVQMDELNVISSLDFDFSNSIA